VQLLKIFPSEGILWHYCTFLESPYYSSNVHKFRFLPSKTKIKQYSLNPLIHRFTSTKWCALNKKRITVLLSITHTKIQFCNCSKSFHQFRVRRSTEVFKFKRDTCHHKEYIVLVSAQTTTIFKRKM